MIKEFENIALVGVEVELDKSRKFFCFLTAKKHESFDLKAMNDPHEIFLKEQEKNSSYLGISENEVVKEYPTAKGFSMKFVTTFENQESYEMFVETDQLSAMNNKDITT